jgi:hypothetical protein
MPDRDAKQSTTVAAQFLAWLAEHGRDLHSASQHDIDTWFADGPSTRKHARRFLSWARQERLLRGIEVPTRPPDNGPVMGPRERLQHLRRLLEDADLHIGHRVLGVFVLLFGQPLSTIVRLPRSAVSVAGEQVSLTLGEQALVLSPAVAELMITFLDDPRFRGNTAANKDSPWLFPGTQPGRPMHVYSAHQILKDAGIPARSARAGAWFELVRRAPPAVLADALGVTANTAMRYRPWPAPTTRVTPTSAPAADLRFRQVRSWDHCRCRQPTTSIRSCPNGAAGSCRMLRQRRELVRGLGLSSRRRYDSYAVSGSCFDGLPRDRRTVLRVQTNDSQTVQR